MVWRQILLEIGIRALKKIHLTHFAWALNRYDLHQNDILKLNNGDGVLLALETTVASEISAEFIYSLFTNGIRINNEPRFYEIKREVNCSSEEPIFLNSKNKIEQKNKKVDLYVRRREWDKKNDTYEPVFIELKRASYYDFKLNHGISEISFNNRASIQIDIENLKAIRSNLNSLEIEDGPFENCLLYQLVWGEIQDNDVECFRSTLAKSLEIEEYNIYLRWMPLEYEQPFHLPKVKKWLYLAVIEIDPPS